MRDSRYIIGFAVTLVVLLLLFIVYRVAQTQAPGQQTAPLSLTDYAQGTAEVRFTTEGPVTANASYRSEVITVGPTSTTIEEDLTYNQQPLVTQTYPNVQSGFEQFMYALQYAGFTKSRSAATGDERGVCPTGRRYTYDLIDSSDKIIMHSWTSSCASATGSFGGSTALVNHLFELQVPNYNMVSAAANRAAVAQEQTLTPSPVAAASGQ